MMFPELAMNGTSGAEFIRRLGTVRCICGMWPHVAIMRCMTSTGIRELKDNLSRYIRRIEAGERIAITAHGRVVAELVPPGGKATQGTPSRFDELVASGVIRPPLEAGDPTEDWPDIELPPGTATELIDADRGEA
jgi:antitoxin (DNA-binding transcriptional repressor) of toxin-antitoxin stability system